MVRQTDEQKATLKRLTEAWDASERLHQIYRPRWERYFGLWSNYTDARDHVAANPRDRDDVVHWAQREWGAELFIPMVFSIVETVVPRVVSQRQRMLAIPRPLQPMAQAQLARMEDNAENHRLLIDSQQQQAKYELTAQDVAKDGLIYGIGIQKSYWRREQRTAQRIVPHIYTGQPCLGEHREMAYDDPYAVAVDPFDFRWDPAAASIDAADYAFHRTWRNTRYVVDMLQQGRWQLDGWTVEDLKGSGAQRFDEVWAQRMRSMGLTGDLKRSDIHEVWEFHDGAEVITVIDREYVVQQGPNPLWHGELPFQVYRPTTVTHRMVGRGEVEPVEDLQLEINTLRSQRRDNATLTLMQSYAYSEGMVDPADIKFGAGMLMPVRGDPHEFLFPIPTGQIPYSGYKEEDYLKGDFDRTSGISDVVAGADPSGGVSSTATGAQLVQAAANKRISLKARRLEVEVIAETCRQWAAMNQRMILARPVQKPALPTPDEPDRRYTWVTLGPLELAGEFVWVPEGGDQEDNVPQKRADANQLLQMFGNDQFMDPRAVRMLALRKMDVTAPESMFAPPPPPVQEIPPEALDNLQRMGVPREMIARAVMAAQHQAQAEQQGQLPAPNQQQLPAGTP